MSVIRPLILVLTCTTLVPTLAHAQAGMLFGRAFENGESDFSRGYSVVGTFALRRTARLGVRFDVGFHTFTRSRIYNTPCLPPSAGGPPCGAQPVRGNDITAVSSAASVVLNESPGRNGFYWMAGVGVYAFTKTPGDGAYTRLGLNGGGGFQLGPNVVFEVRYHGLIDPRTTRGFIPITLGFRF